MHPHRPLLVLSLLLSCPALAQVSVYATVETDPALTSGDAVDDPAVWHHPTDLSKSLIIGTDKQSGLFVYGLDGKQLQRVNDGTTGNVDIRYNFPLGGNNVAIVVTNNRSTHGLSIYGVDAATRKLSSIAAGSLPAGIETYGLCLYRSAATGKYYAFITDKSGLLQQWELYDNGSGKVTATKRREFDVGSQIEGCVADDDLGYLYVGEEDVGVWKYSAEPDGGTTRTQMDKTGSSGNLTADVEGLAIYHSAPGTGYLLVSSQGNNTFNIYTREGKNTFIGKFKIASGAIDDVTDCDGIEVSNMPLGSGFPKGVFIAQDLSNPGANQNFKLVPWDQIASKFTPALIVDTTSFDPRLNGAGNNPGPTDGGTPTDAGTTDAGTPKDAGTAQDAGMPPDAGTEHDAGTPTDAGSAHDAGGNEHDAGTPGEEDAGAQAQDAGSERDAGPTSSPNDPDVDPDTLEPISGGCSATGASPAFLVLLGAAVTLLRSRGARRSSEL